MKKEYLECGKILGPHGVKGLIKVDCWCDSPKVLIVQRRVFLAEGGGYRELRIESAAQHGPLVLLSLAGIDNREYVQSLKNTVLYLKREDIPLKRGAHFLADLIGLECIDINTGHIYGRVKDITDGARTRLYVIETERGDVLLPDVPEFIKKTDEEKGIFISPIPGFFD